MASKNLIEALGIFRLTSSQHWDRHPVVGLSALCFVAPATAFFVVTLCILSTVPRPYSCRTMAQLCLYTLLGLLFWACTLTCVLADFVFIRRGHRSRYGKIDIWFASGTFFVCILDFALRASLLETSALVCIAVAAFLYSGKSTSCTEWVCRHSTWHVIAGADATYGALRHLPEEDHLRALPLRAWVFFGSSALMAALALGSFSWLVLRCAAPARACLWERGARFAHWKPVHELAGGLSNSDLDSSSGTDGSTSQDEKGAREVQTIHAK